MVDYIITPHDCLLNCSDFKVITCNGAVNMFDLQGMISAKNIHKREI